MPPEQRRWQIVWSIARARGKVVGSAERNVIAKGWRTRGRPQSGSPGVTCRSLEQYIAGRNTRHSGSPQCYIVSHRHTVFFCFPRFAKNARSRHTVISNYEQCYPDRQICEITNGHAKCHPSVFISEWDIFLFLFFFSELCICMCIAYRECASSLFLSLSPSFSPLPPLSPVIPSFSLSLLFFFAPVLYTCAST